MRYYESRNNQGATDGEVVRCIWIRSSGGKKEGKSNVRNQFVVLSYTADPDILEMADHRYRTPVISNRLKPIEVKN
jgi:hypothetical protein